MQLVDCLNVKQSYLVAVRDAVRSERLTIKPVTLRDRFSSGLPPVRLLRSLQQIAYENGPSREVMVGQAPNFRESKFPKPYLVVWVCLATLQRLLPSTHGDHNKTQGRMFGSDQSQYEEMVAE